MFPNKYARVGTSVHYGAYALRSQRACEGGLCRSTRQVQRQEETEDTYLLRPHRLYSRGCTDKSRTGMTEIMPVPRKNANYCFTSREPCADFFYLILRVYHMNWVPGLPGPDAFYGDVQNPLAGLGWGPGHVRRYDAVGGSE